TVRHPLHADISLATECSLSWNRHDYAAQPPSVRRLATEIASRRGIILVWALCDASRERSEYSAYVLRRTGSRLQVSYDRLHFLELLLKIVLNLPIVGLQI